MYLVLARPQDLFICVRHYVDGPVRCEVWGSGTREDRLPHVLHTRQISVTSAVLLIGDVDEDIVLKVKPDSSDVGVTVRADTREHAAHIQVELSGP